MALRKVVFLCLFTGLIHPFCGHLMGQQTSVPFIPALPTIQQLASKAGYIFSGTVISVERSRASNPGSVASTQITFHVDEGLRGVRSGQTLTIREWPGLWSQGERYRPGERVVLFLYRP